MLNSKRKLKPWFTINADFESILVSEGNRKQNLEESYRNKYQRYIACSYGYKLKCIDDKFNKSYLGKDVVYNFINSMIEINFFIEMNIAVKKLFDKELVMTKEDDEDFKNSTKSWIC